MSLYTGPRDMAQPTRWVSTIKRLPHCNTRYHFTGFTFPKLRFQLLPILKHSSLVLSPRWSNLPQKGFPFQRGKKKKREMQTYIIWNVKVTLRINKELHQCWEVLQYRNVCRWCILLYKKEPVFRKHSPPWHQKDCTVSTVSKIRQLPAWTGGYWRYYPISTGSTAALVFTMLLCALEQLHQLSLPISTEWEQWVGLTWLTASMWIPASTRILATSS